ncbi:MAG: hypothetical protein MJB14_12010 [Spirochaetes bacterium]|nr:hypothetical protein [Spirochaetota bacterium]
MNTEIIEKMKELGLNEYEAKAYLGLLKDNPVNGYTLSKNTSIPRSRIYEVLENLKAKQFVFEEQSEKSSLYFPIKPDDLAQKMEKHFQSTISKVANYTKQIYSEKTSVNHLLAIKGRKQILEFINRMIGKAKKSISLFVWEEEIDLLKTSLDKALLRGINIKGMFFGKNNPYKELIIHRRINRYIAEKDERSTIVVIDNKEVMLGVISRGEESQATWTADFGFVEMCQDYIIHDIMLNLYAYHLKPEEREEFELFTDQIRMSFYEYDSAKVNRLNEKENNPE